MTLRLAAGLLLAGAIALLARRARSLSTCGAVAATLVGGACVAVGWAWGALLVAYFVASSLLSRWREGAKADRTAGVVAKGGARDAMQVLANGGLYAGAALLTLAWPAPWLEAVAVGALAASASDTWATEIGTLAPRPPRLVTTWRPVPTGTSGAVTALGTAGAAGGALFVAGAAALLGWPARVATAVALGGIIGSAADTVLGATLQARRWCDTCGSPTERLVHRCGSPTRVTGGLAWLDNDRVNVAATIAGAMASGAIVALAMPRG